MTLEEEFGVATAHGLSAHAAIRIIDDGRGPVTAVLTGELDLSCVGALTAVLFDAVDAHRAGLVLDMGEVEFCACCIVSVLLRARAFASSLGHGFTLGPHSQAVARVLELSGTRPLLTTWW